MWKLEPLQSFYVGTLPEGIVTGGVIHTHDGQNHPALQSNGKPVAVIIKPNDELQIHLTIGESYAGLVVAVTILHSLGPFRLSFAKPFTYEGAVPLLFNVKAKKDFELPETANERTH
jgi:hypothetical protein